MKKVIGMSEEKRGFIRLPKAIWAEETLRNITLTIDDEKISVRVDGYWRILFGKPLMRRIGLRECVTIEIERDV